MLNIIYFHFNELSVNTWVVWDEALETVIVDPGCSSDEEFEALTGFIDGKGLKPAAVLLTHGHIDHVLGVRDCCERYGIRAFMSADDRVLMDDHWATGLKFGLADRIRKFESTDVTDGQVLHLTGVDWKVIATPGHSPGSVCYWCESEGILLSGDTLFKETIGRSDLQYGDYDHLIVSIMEKVMGLPGDTDVLPGHGSPTKISHERTHNPFLQPFNEPEEEGIDWNADGIELNG